MSLIRILSKPPRKNQGIQSSLRRSTSKTMRTRSRSPLDCLWACRMATTSCFIPLQEFWLEKSKGRVCIVLSSKALVITGIDDRRYWVHMPTTESRFHSVAYLQQIWWFEVVGEIDFCFPAGSYSLYFRLHLGKASKRFGRRVCSSEQIHGWDKKPVRFQLSTSDGQHALSQCYLDEPGSWILYHVGDFVASKPEQSIKLKFSLAQIDCTHTKGGLCVDSVLIYPKGFQQEKVGSAQE